MVQSCPSWSKFLGVVGGWAALVLLHLGMDSHQTHCTEHVNGQTVHDYYLMTEKFSEKEAMKEIGTDQTGTFYFYSLEEGQWHSVTVWKESNYYAATGTDPKKVGEALPHPYKHHEGQINIWDKKEGKKTGTMRVLNIKKSTKTESSFVTLQPYRGKNYKFYEPKTTTTWTYNWESLSGTKAKEVAGRPGVFVAVEPLPATEEPPHEVQKVGGEVVAGTTGFLALGAAAAAAPVVAKKMKKPKNVVPSSAPTVAVREMIQLEAKEDGENEEAAEK